MHNDSVMHTYTHEDLKSMAEDVKLAQFLRDIYKWEDDYSISYASRKILWENKLTGKDQDPKWLEKYREQMVHTVQTVLRLWSNGYSEVELEAERAEDVVEQVLRFACNNIDCRELGKVHASCGAVFHTYPKVVRELGLGKPRVTPTALRAVLLCKGIQQREVEKVLVRRDIQLYPAALETLTTLLNTPEMVRDLLDRGLGRWEERHEQWLPTLVEAAKVPQEVHRQAEAESRGYRPSAACAIAGITYAWDLLEKFISALRPDILRLSEATALTIVYEEDEDGCIDQCSEFSSVVAYMVVWGYKGSDGSNNLRKITTTNPWDSKEVKTFYFVRG